MLDDKIEELEYILLPHAFPRLKKTPLDAVLYYNLSGKIIKNHLFPDHIKNIRQRRDFYLEILIKSFIRVIINCLKEICITHIASIIIAETNFVLNLYSWAPISRVMRTDREAWHVDMKFILESEIHEWLIFLEQNGKLPGKYERLLGVYTGNVIK
ncbi:MAG: hypothetical protein ACFFBP_13195 [Promethearchaeota archaeon]